MRRYDMPMHIRSIIAMSLLCLLVVSPARSMLHDPPCPAPMLLDESEPLISASWFAIDGNYAYIIADNESFTDNISRFVIIDISKPNNLITMSSIDLPFGSAFYVQINQNTAYLFNYSKVYSIDITDPASPAFSDEYVLHTPEYPLTSPILNNLMYVYNSDIIDVSDPLHPKFAGNNPIEHPIAFFLNGIGYTTTGQAVDMSDPLNPKTTSNSVASREIRDFVAFNNILVGLNGNGEAIDISEPYQPRRVESNINLYTHYVRAHTTLNSVVYSINEQRNGFNVYDASNPREAITTTRIELDYPSSLRGIEYKDGVLFALTHDALLSYVVSTSPHTASHQSSAPSNDVILRDNTLISSNDGGSVQFFDVSDRTLPLLTSTFQLPTQEPALAIDYKENTAYIATYRNKLNLIDITEPSNPTLISNINTGLRAADVRVVDNTLYVLDRFLGLSIYDISNTNNPELISTTDTPGWAESMTIDSVNQTAYISQGQYELQIIDISDPVAPTIIATIPPIPSGSSVSFFRSSTVSGNLLYTAESRLGYRIFDVSDPSSPIEIAHHQAIPQTDNNDGISSAFQITIDNNTLYLANGTGGFTAYDNTNLMNPVQTNWIRSSNGDSVSSIRSIKLRDNIAFTAAYEGGLRIYDLNDCTLCRADFNNDGAVNFFDMASFLEAFSNQNPAADYFNNDDDGVINFFDISAFLTAYKAGCS
jgi:hypothetical protein